ncbi:MAG: dockerin type I repeat-containing protein [Bacteroidaceae bacterium]|nr:dockerin type I repeat-containing protein [Bacteroidaceae bacterium]
MNYKKLLSTALLAAAFATHAAAYTVTPAEQAPQWQIDWRYNQQRPEWQEPQAAAYSTFAVMLITIEEELQPYATPNDLMAIFVGDELRGLASPLVQANGTVDATRFLLKAYSNEGSGDNVDITLQYYNAQLKQLFTLAEKMTLDEDANLGIYDDFVPFFTLGTAKYPVVTTIDPEATLAAAGITPAVGDVIAAFVGDECRGVSQWSELLGATLSVFLYAADEDIVLKYYDAKGHRIITFDSSMSGDVNADGTVNGTDLVALTNIILGKSQQTPAADVNGDTQVNGTDYVALVNMVLGKSTKAPRRIPRETRAPAATALSIEPFDIKGGETQELVVSLANPADEITLVQFDMTLPAGLALKTTDGDFDYDIAGRTTWRKHSLDANRLPDGSIRFLLASNSNATLTGTEGAIITMTLVADASFTGGTITLDNILMVTPAEKEITQEACTCSIGEQTPVTPPTTGTAKLAIEEFSITKGGSEGVLVIDLINPDDEITLVQFDLRLPDGMTLKTTDGDYDIDIAGRTTWRKHSLDAYPQADGTIRFLLASSSNALLTGKEGAIITMTVEATADYRFEPLAVENILLVTPNEQEVRQDNVQYTPIRYVPTAIADVATPTANDTRIFSLAGQRLASPRRGLNIVGGKKVVTK